MLNRKFNLKKFLNLFTHWFFNNFVIVWSFIGIYWFHKRPSAFVRLNNQLKYVKILFFWKFFQQHIKSLTRYFTWICLINFFKRSRSFAFKFFMFAKFTDEFRWQLGHTYSSILSASDCSIPTHLPWNQSWHLSQQM